MKNKENDWKDRLGVVFSTNPDFSYETGEDEDKPGLPPGKQNLMVLTDRKQRKGKVVTLVTGFVGPSADLDELGRELRRKCGTGGSVKEGEIILQGDVKVKVVQLLSEQGYRVKQR